MIVINAEEPFYLRPFQLQVSGGGTCFHPGYFAFSRDTKYPDEHVEKVDANIRGDSPRLGCFAFPAGVIPISSGSDVSKVDVVSFVGRACLYFFTQGNYRGVKAKLSDCEDVFGGFACYF